MSNSITYIKKELVSYGLSTSTPSLEGDERYNELLSRLQEYKNKITPIQLQTIHTTEDGTTISNIDNLTIGEIKSKLIIYGEVRNIHIKQTHYNLIPHSQL